MRDLLSWNLSLGRWGHVQVRLHVFFLLLAVVALHFSSQSNKEALLWETLAVLAILFLSVLAHEGGHCLAASRVGGSVDQILLWPLGGLTQIHISHDPQSEFFTAFGGIMVNLMICLLLAPLLVVQDGLMGIVQLMNPLLPPAAEELSWLNAAQWTFWINWLLALVNVLPAVPFDGGRVCRAVLWLHLDFRAGVLWAARTAQVTAVFLWFAALMLMRSSEFSFAALPFALIGILLFFSAKQEIDRLSDAETDDAEFGYDFSQGYTSLEKAGHPRKAQPGPLKKWLEERRANRLKRQQQLEADEERRADEVLLRLHQVGMHSLSDEERALLNRVSARYRNRQRQ